mgnify:CR=1 FL=1
MRTVAPSSVARFAAEKPIPVPAAAVTEIKRAYHAVYAPGQACAARAQAELATGSYHTAEGRAFLEFFLGGKRGRFVQPS